MNLPLMRLLTLAPGKRRTALELPAVVFMPFRTRGLGASSESFWLRGFKLSD